MLRQFKEQYERITSLCPLGVTQSFISKHGLYCPRRKATGEYRVWNQLKVLIRRELALRISVIMRTSPQNPPRSNRKISFNSITVTGYILDLDRPTSLSPASGTTRIYIATNLTPALGPTLATQQPWWSAHTQSCPQHASLQKKKNCQRGLLKTKLWVPQSWKWPSVGCAVQYFCLLLILLQSYTPMPATDARWRETLVPDSIWPFFLVTITLWHWTVQPVVRFPYRFAVKERCWQTPAKKYWKRTLNPLPSLGSSLSH